MATAAPTSPPRWAAFLPGAWQIRHYERPWLRGDLIAGLAVAAYLVPQVMAYAELAGLPAVQGLWARLARCCSTPSSARRGSCRWARSRRRR